MSPCHDSIIVCFVTNSKQQTKHTVLILGPMMDFLHPNAGNYAKAHARPGSPAEIGPKQEVPTAALMRIRETAGQHHM